MSAFNQAGLFLVDFVGGFYVTILLLRLLLPIVKADYYNPVSQFVVKASAPVLIPFRKILPTYGRFDSNVLVMTIMIQALLLWAIISMSGASLSITAIFISSLIWLANSLLNIYLYGIIIMIVASWIAPQSRHPALLLVYQIIEPALAPLRRLLPPMGGLDLSPMLAMVVIYVLRIFLTSV